MKPFAQIVTRFRRRARIFDYTHDFVDIFNGNNKPLEYVTARKRLFQLVSRTPENDLPLILYIIPYYIQKPELARTAARDCYHIDTERTFEVGILKQKF